MNDDEFEVLFTSEDYKKLEQKVKKYEKQIVSLAREKQKLTEKIFILTEENTKQQKNISSNNQNIKYLSEEGLRMSKTLLDIQNSNHELKISIVQTQKSLATKNLEAIKEKESIQMQFQEALVELQQQKNEMLKLQKQLEEKQKKYFINHLTQTELLGSQIVQEIEQKKNLSENIQKLARENSLLIKKNNDFEERVSKATDELKVLTNEYECKMNKIIEEKNQLNAQIINLKNLILENESKIEQQEQKLNVSQATIDQLSHQLQQQQKQNQKLQRNVQSQELERKYLKEKLEQLKQETDEKSSASLSSWAQKEQLLKQENENLRDMLEKEKATSKQVFEQLGRKIDKMEQKQYYLSQEIRKYVEYCDQINKKMQDLRMQRERTEKQYEDIIHDLEHKLEKKARNKSNRLQELTKEIENYFEKIVLGLMDIGGLEPKQIKDLLKDNKKIVDSIVTEVVHQYEKMIVKKQK